MTSNVIDIRLARLARQSRSAGFSRVIEEDCLNKFLGLTIQRLNYDGRNDIWYQSSYSPEGILYSGDGVGVSEVLSDLLVEHLIESDDPDAEISCAIEEIESYLVNLRRFRDDFRLFKSCGPVKEEAIPGGNRLKPRIRVKARTEPLSGTSQLVPVEPTVGHAE